MRRRFVRRRRSLTRSEGRSINYAGRVIEVELIQMDRLTDLDLVFLCAGGAISRELAPVLRKACGLVVDNSSVYRLDENVPLIIPEITEPKPPSINMSWPRTM